MTEIAKRDQRERWPRRSPWEDPTGPDWTDVLGARRLLGKVLKRKHQIGLVFLIVVIPAAIATYLTTPLYRSAVQVQVNPAPVQVMPYRDVADTATSGANYDNYVGTQEQLLNGPGLKTRVASRLQAEFQEPISLEASKLGEHYSVRKIERSELFELIYLGPDPETAAVVANLFAEEFAKQNFELRQATRLKAEQDLKKELEALEQRLQLSEKELTTYAQRHDILSLEEGQVDPLQERLRALNQEVAQSEAAVAVARSSMDSLRTASLGDFPQRLVTQQIAQLETRLLELEQELITLRSTFGENWPAVVEKRTEAALVREQLTREKSVALARSLEQARLDLEGAEARRRLSLQALDEQKGLVNRFHDASIDYSILKRDVDTNRNLYEGLLERLRQTGVMAGFQFGNIQVVEPARPNPVQDSPKVLWNLGIAALLGLALGVCLAILLDVWDDSISTLEEVEQLAPSLGSLPLMKAVGSLNPVRALLPANGNGAPTLDGGAGAAQPSELTESIRGICASILLSRSDERPRIIVVTSAIPSEGKTTLVTHLGRAFAEAGLKTLLIEADLRKPDLARTFSVGNEDGLSLYLAGHVSPWPKVHETQTPNLFVAAGGPVPPNPAALLHSERLTHFLQAAAVDYQVVIIDAPPLSVADARILGTKADGVVLVVRAGRTAKNLVRRAWSTLDSSGANVLGMVLNGEEPHPEALTYYGYDYSHG